MKKRYIITLSLIICIAAVCVWQKNNLEALYIFATSDREATAELIEKNKAELSELLKKYSDSVPRQLTAEEEEKIANGELSVEDAVKILLEEDEEVITPDEPSVDNNAPTVKEDVTAAPNVKTEPPKELPKELPKPSTSNPNAPSSPFSSPVTTTVPADKINTQPTGGTSPTVKDETVGTKPSADNPSGKNKEKESAIIKRYTAELYSMKAYYIGQLNQIEGRARAEFSAMSSTEKKNLSKAAFVGKYAGYATGLLGECDGKVSSLLSQMKSELTAIGGDTSIISTIKQAYESEKAARKAYYLNMVS